MTSETIMLRTMRRTDLPALEELVRQAWYADDESAQYAPTCGNRHA